MGENSGIQWTTHTFNPWVGCQRVSPGCVHCYAETYDKRVGGVPKKQRADPNVAETRWGPNGRRTRTSVSNWKQPLQWDAAAKAAGERHRVFCSSLADVFEDRPELEPWRTELFGLIALTPHLDWLLLTKRPENIARMLPAKNLQPWSAELWPNVWLGTTVEDQQRANERVPALLSVPAAVRFLSMEPLLERVDVSKWLWPLHWHWDSKYRTPQEAMAAGAYAEQKRQALIGAGRPRVNWMIIGGESGAGARPFHLEWARDLVKQARSGAAAPFVKQLGARPMAMPPMCRGWVPVHLNDAAGGDMAEWPEDLRVREFPQVSR